MVHCLYLLLIHCTIKRGKEYLGLANTYFTYFLMLEKDYLLIISILDQFQSFYCASSIISPMCKKSGYLVHVQHCRTLSSTHYTDQRFVQSIGNIEKATLQISIGWLSVISSVIPLALKRILPIRIIPIGKIL